MNEPTFYGLDIPSFIKRQLEQSKSSILQSAPQDVAKGYSLGITNSLLLLQQLYDSMSESEFLICTSDPNMAQYCYEELEDL